MSKYNNLKDAFFDSKINVGKGMATYDSSLNKVLLDSLGTTELISNNATAMTSIVNSELSMAAIANSNIAVNKMFDSAIAASAITGSPIAMAALAKAGAPVDLTGSPGPAKLIAGDMNAGFFGVVPSSELFTGTELASLCGITQGTSQFNDEGWLKFALDGDIIFKSKKTLRHSISWDHINSMGCVKGTKQVSKSTTNFKVTLMKGALNDPSVNVGGDQGAKGSEWNRLMLPIHIQAKDKSWAYPAYVEENTPYWGIDFTDADLQTHNSAGNGSYQWCQEVYQTTPAHRVYRGYSGVSGSGGGASSVVGANYGWSPVLRVAS